MPKQITKIPSTINRFTAVPMNSTQKRKVAGYARVSTDHEDQTTSYEAQLDYYTNYIKQHNDWEFVKVYSDEGITGTSIKKREGFNRMIKDALDGKIDLIITKSVSRFARNTVDSLTTIRELKSHNVEIFFEKEGIWTFDSKGELMLTILSSLAQEESRSISENVTWGQRKRMADGKVFVSYSTFLGYDKGEDGNLVINEEEAKIVRLIYRLFLSGFSYEAIARKLTEMKIKTPLKKDVWSTSTIRSVLTNEKYKGDALLQKTYTPDFLTKKSVKNKGEVPQYYVEGNHEPIIEPEVFDQVQDMVKKRSLIKGNTSARKFSTKIVCGQCGCYYGSKIWHSTDKYKKVVWQCNGKYKNRTFCKTPVLTKDEIKNAFVDVLNRLIDERCDVLSELKRVELNKELKEEQKKLEVRMDMVSDAVRKKIIENTRILQDQNEYNESYNALIEEYESLKAELESVNEKIEEDEAKMREVRRFIKGIEKMDGKVAEFDDALWNSLVDHVTVGVDGGLMFTMVGGMKM